MDLRTYLFRKRMTASDFGREIGYAPRYLIEIANGSKKPGKGLARIIEMATKGQVSYRKLSTKLPQKKGKKSET